jgi:NAD(P)H-dependent FMN reductase
MSERPLFIPVILGTARQGSQSEKVANFVLAELAKFAGVETVLVDVRELNLPLADAGEAIKDANFSALCERADGFVIVAPEYNHGYPGLLKHALDTNLKEYIHKACGIVGVSAGPFGGVRAIQNLLPVVRELGLVNIFWDGNFSYVQDIFNHEGNINDAPTHAHRLEKFFKELIWMSRILRYGRENVPLE